MTAHLRLANHGVVRLGVGHYRLNRLEFRSLGKGRQTWIVTRAGESEPLVIGGRDCFGTLGDAVRAIQRVREAVGR